MTPVRLPTGDPRLLEVLALIRSSFAYMHGRIDPPSSVLSLDLAAVKRQAQAGEIWGLGEPLEASVFLTPKSDCLYIGKLAVAESYRKRGLARLLVDHAATRARALGLAALELQTRVELEENHMTFGRMGFVQTGQTAHAGYDRPTSITMRRAILP